MMNTSAFLMPLFENLTCPIFCSSDISMQDMTVAYDIDSQRLGWKYANCDRLPKS